MEARCPEISPKLAKAAEDMDRMADYVRDLRNILLGLSVIGIIAMLGLLLFKCVQSKQLRRKQTHKAQTLPLHVQKLSSSSPKPGSAKASRKQTPLKGPLSPTVFLLPPPPASALIASSSQTHSMRHSQQAAHPHNEVLYTLHHQSSTSPNLSPASVYTKVGRYENYRAINGSICEQ